MEKLLAAQRRIDRDARLRFDDAVEAVRVGTMIATNQRALNQWRLNQRRAELATGATVGLTGGDLERAVMAIAARSPEYVVVKV